MGEPASFENHEGPPIMERPELEIIEPDGPERVSFISGANSQPNYEELLNYASKPINGKMLLIGVLEQTGMIVPLARIHDYETTYKEFTARREALDAKQASGANLSDEERAFMNGHKRIMQETGDKLQFWHRTENLVNKASNFYHTRFFENNESGSPNVDRKKLTELYDKTAAFEETPLLTVMNSLRQSTTIKLGSRPNDQMITARDNVLEADRIARLLILEEVHEISFD